MYRGLVRRILIRSLSVLALLAVAAPAGAADPTFEITADRSSVSFPSDARLEYRIRITTGADDEVIPLSVGAGGEQGRLEGVLQGETLRVLGPEVRLDGPGTLRQGSSTHGDPCTGRIHVPLPRAFSGSIGQSYGQIVELPAHTQTTLVVPAGVTRYAPWPDTRHRISVFRELYGGTLQEGGPLPVPELTPAGQTGVRVTLQTTPDTAIRPCDAPFEISTHRAIRLTGTTDPPIPGQLLDVVVVEPGTTEPRLSERVRVADDGSYSATYTPLRSGMRRSIATSRASAWSPRSYTCDMSGKRGPSESSLGPISGLSPSRLLWSAMSTRSPGLQNGFIPPHALETISVPAPNARITRTGKGTCCSEYPS